LVKYGDAYISLYLLPISPYICLYLPASAYISQVVKYGDAGEVGQDTLHRNMVSALGPEASKAGVRARVRAWIRLRIRLRRRRRRRLRVYETLTQTRTLTRTRALTRARALTTKAADLAVGPYASPISPLYLPYISPIPPLYLPYISPISPLYLPYRLRTSLWASSKCGRRSASAALPRAASPR
jgi:hypothetical protein